MKALFLDIDGVLCTHQDNSFLDEEETFNEGCCKNLKSIIDNTGCKIVLISSWRLYASYRSLLLRLLKPYGITKLDFLGVTKSLISRAEEICEFLNTHKDIDEFVVLDDEKIISKLIPSDRIINTQKNCGITKEITKQCIELLT